MCVLRSKITRPESARFYSLSVFLGLGSQPTQESVPSVFSTILRPSFSARRKYLNFHKNNNSLLKAVIGILYRRFSDADFNAGNKMWRVPL